MKTQLTIAEMRTLLAVNDNTVEFASEEDILIFLFNEKTGKFAVEFNCRFMAVAKTITNPLKKFNELAVKYSIDLTTNR